MNVLHVLIFPHLCRYLLNAKQYLYLDLFYLYLYFLFKIQVPFLKKYIKSKQLGLKNIEVPCPLNPCSLSFHQEGAELRTAELFNLLYQGFSVSFKSASVWSVVVNRKYKQQDLFFSLFFPLTLHTVCTCICYFQFRQQSSDLAGNGTDQSSKEWVILLTLSL